MFYLLNVSFLPEFEQYPTINDFQIFDRNLNLERTRLRLSAVTPRISVNLILLTHCTLNSL
jgi:hypothetical protein